MKYCGQCGRELVDGSSFCGACGAPFIQYEQVPIAAMRAEEFETAPPAIQTEARGLIQAVQWLENSIKDRINVDKSFELYPNRRTQLS